MIGSGGVTWSENFDVKTLTHDFVYIHVIARFSNAYLLSSCSSIIIMALGARILGEFPFLCFIWCVLMFFDLSVGVLTFSAFAGLGGSILSAFGEFCIFNMSY